MNDSGYDSNSAIIPHRAAGYVYGAGGFENAAFIDMSIPRGAGGLYSTTGDLVKWNQALFGGKVLKPDSLAKMTTPFRENYALGLSVESAGGRKTIRHEGRSTDSTRASFTSPRTNSRLRYCRMSKWMASTRKT